MTELASRPGAGATPGARRNRDPDRMTVALAALTAFLLVLALLGSQLRVRPARAARRQVLVRRVYETTVVERSRTAGGRSGSGGASVTQSTSGASAAASGAEAPLTTRAS